MASDTKWGHNLSELFSKNVYCICFFLSGNKYFSIYFDKYVNNEVLVGVRCSNILWQNKKIILTLPQFPYLNQLLWYKLLMHCILCIKMKKGSHKYYFISVNLYVYNLYFVSILLRIFSWYSLNSLLFERRTFNSSMLLGCSRFFICKNRCTLKKMFAVCIVNCAYEFWFYL